MIDIPAHYADGQMISNTPAVYLFEEFATPFETRMIIERARAQMKRALVSAEKAGTTSKRRSGRNCWLRHDETPELLNLAQRISDLVGIDLIHAESFQVIHYSASQEYAAHFDAWDASTERGQRCMQRGGQRLVTCLLYLNDVEEGGGTGFPRLDVEVRAREGRMVLFHNCYPGTTERHPDSLHGGLPVAKGEKWAVNLWFREQSYQQKAPSKAAAMRKKFRRVV